MLNLRSSPSSSGAVASRKAGRSGTFPQIRRWPSLAGSVRTGGLMTDADWGVGYAKSLGVLLNGPSLTEPDRYGRLVADTSFYLALNAWEEPLLVLPARAQMGRAVAGRRRHFRQQTCLPARPATTRKFGRAFRAPFHGVPAALGSLNRSRPRLPGGGLRGPAFARRGRSRRARLLCVATFGYSSC